MAMVSSYLGLFGAMGAMAVGQAFTSELFPTSVRIKVWFFSVAVKHISILIVEIKFSTEKKSLHSYGRNLYRRHGWFFCGSILDDH